MLPMIEMPGIVERGEAAAQAAKFTMLPPLARRLGICFEDTTPPRDFTFSGDGNVPLHGLDWGGDGPKVLFLHGGKLTARTWDYVCLGLRHKVHAVALDMRGHGDSGWSDDYCLDAYVADVSALLDALGWQQAHLVGMSLGGMIAAHFAAATPQRIASLTMVDVGPGVVFEATARMRGFFKEIQASDGPEAIIDAAMQISSLGDREKLPTV